MKRLTYKQIEKRLAAPDHRVHVGRMAWKLQPAQFARANGSTAKAIVIKA